MWQLSGGYTPCQVTYIFSSHVTLTFVIKIYVLKNYKILCAIGLYACSRTTNTMNVKSERAIHIFQIELFDSI